MPTRANLGTANAIRLLQAGWALTHNDAKALLTKAAHDGKIENENFVIIADDPADTDMRFTIIFASRGGVER